MRSTTTSSRSSASTPTGDTSPPRARRLFDCDPRSSCAATTSGSTAKAIRAGWGAVTRSRRADPSRSATSTTRWSHRACIAAWSHAAALGLSTGERHRLRPSVCRGARNGARRRPGRAAAAGRSVRPDERFRAATRARSTRGTRSMLKHHVSELATASPSGGRSTADLPADASQPLRCSAFDDEPPSSTAQPVRRRPRCAANGRRAHRRD